MKKKFMCIMLLLLSAIAFTSCGGNGDGNSNNEDTPLVFSVQEVDKVFNPFYSSSAPDSEVIGYTQIGMLTNNNDKIAYGEDEPVVVLDYEEVTEGTPDVDQTTTYYFVLKNNVKFSNGSPLTIKDVLFNLYVYLDPVYTGSSTIYSTDIVGLKEYRTQEADENEQDSFMEKFKIIAEDRITALADASATILEDDPYIDLESFEVELENYTSQEYYENVLIDFKKACELFEEELNTDYANSIGSAGDISFKDSNDNVYNPFKTDIEAFLYNEGYLNWNKQDAEIEIGFGSATTLEEVRLIKKEDAIKTILESKLPTDIIEIIYYWQTASHLYEFLVNEALSDHYESGERDYKNISGIQFINKDKAVTVNGKQYTKPEYAEDGSVKNETNEVLAITINGVDPKAIWNFSFTVAPMYYYSDEEHIKAFDYEENFGVEYSSQDFQNNVIKNPAKIGVPVGAGAYKAARSAGGSDNVTGGEFCDKGVIYYESNEHFLMGEPLVKKIRLQVVAASSILNSLYNGEVDFVSPNAKPETINELKSKSGISSKTIKTSGYGYIGINAGHVPSIEVRQAIMHAIDTASTVSYYGTLASQVHRSMSTASWAYPTGATAYYPFIGGAVPEDLSKVNPAYAEFIESNKIAAGSTLTLEEQYEYIRSLVETAGYVENSNGIYYSGSDTLKYTFTIAGNTEDHPAFNAMYKAAEILNNCGFEITVSTDANALSKLTTGGLAVWAAAWSSTIDPDMYQVYHRDSKATSVNNWGYKQILANNGGKYDVELGIVDELSELIDAGRETTDQSARKAIYSKALDLVMELAVELPTYQRVDLYAYNIKKIDESTLTPDSELSPYNGLTSNIWKLSLVK